MQYSYPVEAEAFRAEVRAWLSDTLTDDIRARDGSVMDPDPVTLERLRTWNRTLADAGYAALSWPVEYGGRGAGVVEQVVFAEEMARAGAPGPINVIGIPNVAPSIMQWATDEQRTRFLGPMLRGDEIWCQGFSEPEAGSDLASLRTTAVLDGDDYVINGQKTWNSLGHLADWCELLVRTTPLDRAPKHKGITCLLVDMHSPGIEVRPMVTITGDREFSEVFFTDVRVPVSARLGPENEGWRVAMTTLTHERAGVAKLHLSLRKKVGRLLDEASTDDPVLRLQLARVYLEAEFLKLLSDRAVSASLRGEGTGAEASIAKLWWSEVEQHVGEVATAVLGPSALAGQWGRDRVYSRAVSIAGGTTQVNKNIVAQRILGLPRA